MKKLLFGLLLSFIVYGSFAQTPLQVATFNLRYNNPGDGDNAWPKRKDEVKALIKYHDFDIFGTQEGLQDQINDLAQLPDYAWVGKARDDGKMKGEHSAIFYKKDRFSLLNHGDFWLSETTDQPSLGWDAVCKRICSWGKFRDKKSNQIFYFFCVHFDHKGEIARKNSADLMIKKIKEIAGTNPVILAGDFNSTPDTYQIKAISSLLNDSRLHSIEAPYGPEGTYNGFHYDRLPANRIDYLFFSKQIKILNYATLDDSFNLHFPSDHFPVTVKAIL